MWGHIWICYRDLPQVLFCVLRAKMFVLRHCILQGRREGPTISVDKFLTVHESSITVEAAYSRIRPLDQCQADVWDLETQIKEP